MDEIMLKIENVSKKYRLGQIGGTTLRDELQRWSARVRGREDPTKMIGEREYQAGETFMALDGVSFVVKKGERVGIIGHNGAGKSTLLKLISRVTAPTGGSIGLNGRVASMLEVGTGFHGELTGRENIYMNGAILGMTKKEIDAKIEDIIEFSECRQFIDTPVKRYSSGMYVKLAFSVAAHLDSEIMIMDEVLAVGDMAFQKKCLDKMNDVSRTEGRTILYVSHNMNTIRQLCERVIVLDHGRIVFDGDVEKGIDMYVNRGVDKRVCYDYSSYKTSPGEDMTLRMLGMELTGRDQNSVEAGDTVSLVLKCRADDDISDVFLRFEIFSMDDTVVGTAFINKPVSAQKNETVEYHLSFPTGNFTPGRYSFAALLFKTNEYGDQKVIHRVFPAFTMEILESPSNNVKWLNRWWGKVRFDDIELKGVEICR